MAGPMMTEEEKMAQAGALGLDPQDTAFWANRLGGQQMLAEQQSVPPPPVPPPGMPSPGPSPMASPAPGPGAGGDSGGLLAAIMSYIRGLGGGGQ